MHINNQSKVHIATVAIFMVVSSAHALAHDSTQKCQRIQTNIDNYAKLKSNGGTVAELTRWGKRQSYYQSLLAEYGCEAER